jgi:hypothetical protein
MGFKTGGAWLRRLHEIDPWPNDVVDRCVSVHYVAPMYLRLRRTLNGHHLKTANFGKKAGEWHSWWAWRASLVECVRVDGKPKQRVFEYLGTVVPTNGFRHHGKLLTWDKLVTRLDAISNRISPEERATIEATFRKCQAEDPTR